jgi:hypothetical protein
MVEDTDHFFQDGLAGLLAEKDMSTVSIQCWQDVGFDRRDASYLQPSSRFCQIGAMLPI